MHMLHTLGMYKQFNIVHALTDNIHTKLVNCATTFNIKKNMYSA